MFLSSGDVIAQRYELEHLLGEGGMGMVWSARHVLTQKRVALKFLKSAADPELVRRFVREAQAASAVRHPNVIGVHDVLLLDGGAPAMVMDLLEGESLAERLARAGPIPIAELAGLMLPVLSALGAVHALGIVHRDLKPDNVFLARCGAAVEPMVLDFGICKLTPANGLKDAATLTATGLMMGTPYYMAPEQVFGERDVDARADVWALGVMLYECSTGHRPIDGENVGQLMKQIMSGSIRPLRELLPQAPSGFIRVVERMLVHDRDARAPDLREAFAVLRTLTHVGAPSFSAAATERACSIGVPLQAPFAPTASLAASVATNPTASRAARHSRALAAAAALTALALAGVVGVRMRTPSPRPTSLGAPSVAAAAAAIPTPTPQAAAPAPLLTRLPSAATAPVVSAAPRRLPTSKRAVKAPAAAPNCDPPYSIDASGRRLFKLECM